MWSGREGVNMSLDEDTHIYCVAVFKLGLVGGCGGLRAVGLERTCCGPLSLNIFLLLLACIINNSTMLRAPLSFVLLSRGPKLFV